MRAILIGAFLLLATAMCAQSGEIWRGAGMVYVTGAPAFDAHPKGAWIAIDTTSGDFYLWDKDEEAWIDGGGIVQFVDTCGAPSYTPDLAHSRYAVDTCDHFYQYRSDAWHQVGSSGSDNQQLTISNDTIYLEDGGFVVLPPSSDTSGYNSSLTISNDSLLLTDGNGTLNVLLSPYLDNTDDQVLSISNDTIYLEDGGFVVLPPSSDTSGYNSSLTISNDSLLLTDGNGTLNVVLSPYLDNTDDQTLSIDSTANSYSLSIEDGNTVSWTKTSLSGYVTGSGTTNELPYWATSSSLGSLTTATYPNLTELSYVKGVTSAIQTQLDAKHGGSLTSGYIPYSSAGGYGLANSGVYWDDANGRLGLGTASPTNRVSIVSNSAYVNIGNIATGYGAIGFSNALLSTSNYVISGDGVNAYVNAPTGGVIEEKVGNGTVGTISGASNAGKYTIGNGTAKVQVGSAGPTYGGLAFNGTLTSSTYNFLSGSSDLDLFINRPTGYKIHWRENNSTDQLTLLSGGNFGIGQTTPTARLHVTGSGSTSATTAVLVENSVGTDAFWSRNDGLNYAQTMVVGSTTKDASAVLEATSTTQGFLTPRMTTAQRDAISSPALGLQLVSTTDSLPYYWNGTAYVGMYADGTGTDDQTLSWSSPNLSIESGNSVDLSGLLDNTDSQTIDTFDISSNNLRASISGDGQPFKSVDLSPYLDNTDGQDLTIGGSGPTYTIDVSGGDDVTISAAGITTLSEGTANVLTITSTEVDGSTTNEIQDLSYTAATGAIGISDGGTGTTIPVMTSSTRGLVPDPDGSGTDEFLREDGTFAAPDFASGTYTPTLTGTANVSSSTAYVCQYMRVGTVVTVSGKVDITPTAANTYTELGMTLPIASNLTTDEECAGSGGGKSTQVTAALIMGDATNDRAEIEMLPGAGSQTYYFTYTYQVK